MGPEPSGPGREQDPAGVAGPTGSNEPRSARSGDTERGIPEVRPVTERARPAGLAPSLSRPERRPELDFMRAFVVAGLVVFHSAVVFASGASWFVKDPRPSLGFTVFLLWGSLWGMPLLFLVSGMGVRYALRTRSGTGFARERLSRLLVPFAVGLAVLVPPMFYIGQLGKPGFHEPYWRFWLTFLNLPAIAWGLLPRGSWTSGGIEFDPAHLWFLYVLLLFSIALLPLFLFLRSTPGHRFIERLGRFTDRHGVLVLSAAAIPLVLVEAGIGPDVNTGGWERLAYLFPLLYGYLIASDPRFETAMRRQRRLTLACALVATAGLIVWAGLLRGQGLDVMTGSVRDWSALQGLAGWSWIVSILGFAGSVVDRRPRGSPVAVGSSSMNDQPRWRRAPGTRTRPCCLSMSSTSRSSWPPPGSSSAGTRRSSGSTSRWSWRRSLGRSLSTKDSSDGSASPVSCSA